MSFISMFRRAERQHELDCPEGPAPGVICVLVHGTFAPGAPWTLDGSPIRASIESALGGRGPVGFYRFIWRGKRKNSFNNTHRDRLAAGEALSQSIRTIASDHPGVPLFLVGHSHGGNVILYALREPELRGLVRGIVTIATPFLIWNGVSVLSLVLGSLMVIVLQVISFACSFLVPALLDQWHYPVAKFFLGMGVYGGTMGLLVLIGWWTRIIDRFETLLRRFQARYEKFGIPSVLDVPKYVAHVEESAIDEAFAWLAFGDTIAMLPMIIIVLLITWILSSYLLMMLFMLFVFPYAIVRPATILGSIVAAIFVIPPVIRSLPLFFGGESIMMNALGSISIRPFPLFMGRNPDDLLREYRPDSYFGHALYNTKKVVDDLSAWIALRCGVETHMRPIDPLAGGQESPVIREPDDHLGLGGYKEGDRCPNCGFSYGWDGLECRHCHHDVAAGRRGVLPAFLRRQHRDGVAVADSHDAGGVIRPASGERED